MEIHDDEVPNRHQQNQIYINEMLKKRKSYHNHMAHPVSNDLASRKDIT